MKREQLLRKLAKDARARGLGIEIDMARGKGGHCVVRCNGRFTVVKSGEITPLMELVIASNWGSPEGGVMHYTAELTRDGEGYVVTFPAFPEANTAGASLEEALENGRDALEVTILTYVKDGRALPSDVATGQDGHFLRPVSVSASVLTKLAFIEAFTASGTTRTALARQLGKGETEIRRMLDPYHKTKISTLEAGLLALGKRLVISVEAA